VNDKKLVMITIDKPLVIHCNLLAHFKRANADPEEKGPCSQDEEKREKGKRGRMDAKS